MSVTAIRSFTTTGDRTQTVKDEWEDRHQGSLSMVLALDTQEASALASLFGDLERYGLPTLPHPNEVAALSRIRKAAFGQDFEPRDRIENSPDLRRVDL